MMHNPGHISPELERIARNYRDDMEIAIDNLNEGLEYDLTRLVEDYGTEAVKAAVEAIEDNLSTYSEPQTSLWEAFGDVPRSEPNEEPEDA